MKEQTNGERFDEFMRTVEGYPELEGTMNLCEDIIEKKTGKMTEKEWQAAEKTQTSKTKQMTSIEWLVEQVNSDCLNSTFIRNDIIKQAKEMHKQEMSQLPQQEISDEEIEKMADELYPTIPLGITYQHTYKFDEKQGFIKGMKLYREQLKLKQPKKD